MKHQVLFISLAIFITLATLSVGKVEALPLPNIKITNIPSIQVTVTTTPTPSPTAIIIRPITKIPIKFPLKKTNALKEIDRRLEGLGKLSDKITKLTKISATQKETLLAQIQVELNKLQELRNKIEAETDTTALKAEKQSITDSYRIFALFIPKIEIIAHAEKINWVANAMIAKTTDETLKSTLNQTIAKAQSAIDLVMPLQPENFPEFRTTLKVARDLLKEARQNLNSVFQTIKSAS